MATILADDDVVLVGPARSGTTLVCALLNEVEGIVALDEPFTRDEIRRVRPTKFLPFLASRFAHLRTTIQEQRIAIATGNGLELKNHYAENRTGGSLRRRVVDVGVAVITKPLGREFVLAAKHTLPFTGIVTDLMRRYRTFAIVRNPLAILASWNTIDSAYREGRAQPYAKHLTGDLPRRLTPLKDRFERQVTLLAWHFEQYRPLLDAAAVIRYEDIIDTGGKVLSAIHPAANRLNRQLASRNTNQLYDRDAIEHLAAVLMRSRGAIWDFYPPASVTELLEEMLYTTTIQPASALRPTHHNVRRPWST